MSDHTEAIDAGWQPPQRAASHGARQPLLVSGAADGHVRVADEQGSLDQTPSRTSTYGPVASAPVRMGARLVPIPPVDTRDPISMLVEPTVAEHRRFCRRCVSPVGRSADGARAQASGACRACGEPFQFEAPLRPGEVLANQYEIAGCIAHGGNGWVYLARDRAVDCWVVVKGVLSAHDPHARSAALAERRILADVDHPNIVKILNVVVHGDEGYIVMEHVRGVNLRMMLEGLADDGRARPLPVEEAIEYVLEILPALDHLHGLGFAYCDFKPDNMMRTERSVKLIDLGSAVRLEDDRGAGMSATRGYHAPELEETCRPTVASDIFTVGRTMAVLCTDFVGYQSSLRYALPPMEEVPLYTQHESLYRWLERATASLPDERFDSIEEMVAQLSGVLHEIVAERTGRSQPSPSASFTGERSGSVSEADPRRLPMPLIDPEHDLEHWLVQSLLENGQHNDAANALDALDVLRDRGWQSQWYRGVLGLLTGDLASARSCFAEAHRALPGELAPKLALAMADDISGDRTAAARMYRRVALTDPAYRSAVFGLARCRLAAGDRHGALTALGWIPETSSNFVTATTMRVQLLIQPDSAHNPADVDAAAALIELLPHELDQRRWLETDALEAILALLVDGRPEDGSRSVLGVPHTQRSIRRGLERAYRTLARHADTPAQRIALVERANEVRPRTVL